MSGKKFLGFGNGNWSLEKQDAEMPLMRFGEAPGSYLSLN